MKLLKYELIKEIMEIEDPDKLAILYFNIFIEKFSEGEE